MIDMISSIFPFLT